MNKISGIAASRGIAIGPAFHFKPFVPDFDRSKIDDPKAEWQRIENALEEAKNQLLEVKATTEETVGSEEASLFGAHIQMLEDPELLAVVKANIEQERMNAEYAFNEAAESFAEKLGSLDSEYLRARASDVRDVRDRVLSILLGKPKSAPEELTEPSVILARDLTPSDTALLDKDLVLGFCTAEGSSTSHTAILARGLGFPAVVGAGPEISEVSSGATVVLDGNEGALLIDPSENITREYRERRMKMGEIMKRAQEGAAQPAITKDGHRIEVGANIANVQEAEAALKAGAEGVGLLRTEFLYLGRDHLPNEGEQYRAYRAILDKFGKCPVILRTLDIGGDKTLPYFELPEENNPFLGLRAIRLTLQHPELMKPQFRAALRAGSNRNLKLMLPMVTSSEEIKKAKNLVCECRDELKDEGQEVAEDFEIGIMVEVPAAAVMARELAKEVDFFSIGTNDLTQYTMAADRTNPSVSSYLTGLEPAVLRLVDKTIKAAHDAGIWVGLCGELAGRLPGIPILLGLHVDELSMNPSAIPLAKNLIRQISLTESEEVAQEALKLESSNDVLELVKKHVPEIDLFNSNL